MLPTAEDRIAPRRPGRMSSGTAAIENDGIKYSPAADFFGTESFSYTIHDGDLASTATATVTVTVTDVEDPPVATADSYTVDEDTTDNLFEVLSNDTDGGSSTVRQRISLVPRVLAIPFTMAMRLPRPRPR